MTDLSQFGFDSLSRIIARDLQREADKREQELHRREREQSLTIYMDGRMPKPTDADIVQAVETGKPLWRTIERAAADEAERKAREEWEAQQLVMIPEPEL